MDVAENEIAGKSQRQFIVWLVGVVLVLDLFVAGLAAFILGQSRLQYAERAAQQAQNLTQALAYSMTGIIDAADVAILAVADEAERELRGGGIDKRTINAFLNRQNDRLRQVENIRMSDPEGRVLYGSGVLGSSVKSLADRDYFMELRHDATPRLIISKPVIGRVSGRWLVVLARRINNPDGSFGGVVCGLVPLEKIDKLLAAIDVGPHGGLSVRDTDMNIVVRHPAMKRGSPAGMKSISEEMRRRYAAGFGSGTFYTPVSWDNIPKTVSYRRLADHPLYVIAALAAEDYLAPWWRDLYRISGLVALFVLVTLVLSRLIHQRWRREKRAETGLRKAKEELELRVAQRTRELFEANCLLTTELAERKRAEESLRQGRNMLAQIIDSIPQSVFWKDRDSVYLGCNVVFARGAGKESPDDIVGKSDYDLPWLPEESEAYRRDDREVMDHNRPKYHIIEQQLQSSGEHLWVDTNKIPLCNDQGEVCGVLGIYDNITERKQVEETRDSALALFQTLLTSSPAGIQVYHGKSGDCVIANQSLANMVGGDLSGLLAQNFRTMSSWRETGVDRIAEQVLADGKTRQMERSFSTTFGKSVHFQCFFSRCEVGAEPHLMCIALDVTEKRRLEDENKRIEEQMLHVQKLESLGILAGGIAHDFNNILQVISGNADLALMRLEENCPVRENVAQIEQAAGRAAELAGQMLAYSGKGRFVIENLDLATVVREMSQMLEVSISKKVALRYDFAPELPQVVGDATQLRQVIMNLVINASEAIGDQSGVIAISTSSMRCDTAFLSDFWINDHLEEGAYVVLDVADTGCGIPPDIISKIFDPFFTTKFTGRGLGMAAVLGIVRGHKGAIRVSSEPGKGTSFRIILPAALPAERPSAAAADRVVEGTGTVLLVDDEETIRNLGEDMLQALGFGVLTACNGREAIEIFRRHREEIVCVLLDLTMPELDGDQTLQELRRIDPHVRAIVASGYSEHEVSQKFAGQERVAFLQKPYKLSSVSLKLTEMVG